MSRTIIIVFLMLLFYNSNGDPIEIQCSPMCVCDIYENLRRASCNNINLVDIEADVHHTAEILDVSHNKIRELRASVFQDINLTKLKLLNLSHNSLSNNINMDAFNGLTELKTLDISYNGVGVLMEIWFKDLPNLREFYASGSHLGSIDINIVAPKLEIIDLSGCKLTQIRADLFVQSPSLKYIDLSKNILRRVTPNIFEPLQQLTNLNLENNLDYICDGDDWNNLSGYVKEHSIAFQTPCKSKPKTVEKFQKMVVDNSIKRNTWILEENNTQSVIQPVVTCPTPGPQPMLMRIISLSPLTVIIGVFVYGLLVGVTVACIYNQCVGFKEQKQSEEFEMKSRLRQPRSNQRIFQDLNSLRKSRMSMYRQRSRDDRNSLIESEFDLSQSSPIPPRRAVFYETQ